MFFFSDTATTEIYTLSLHDALPIFGWQVHRDRVMTERPQLGDDEVPRSEEHTSELQSHSDLVCRLLLEKKNTGLSYKTWTARSSSAKTVSHQKMPAVDLDMPRILWL